MGAAACNAGCSHGCAKIEPAGDLQQMTAPMGKVRSSSAETAAGPDRGDSEEVRATSSEVRSRASSKRRLTYSERSRVRAVSSEGGGRVRETRSFTPLAAHAREFDARSNPFSMPDREVDEAKLLLEAARAGNTQKAIRAVDQGASLLSTNLRDQTALMLAAGSCAQGAFETLKFLLGAMAELDSKDDQGWTALMHACRNNQQESVQLLLESNASVEAVANDGKSPVTLSAMEGAASLVLHLVESKASVNGTDEIKWSALHYACDAGHFDCMRLLLKRKADVQETSKDGSTPLMVAASHGHVSMGEALHNYGANLNVKTAFGDTALLVAIKANQTKFSHWLLNAKANIKIKNREGEDAMSVAGKLGAIGLKSHMEKLLLQKGGADKTGAAETEENQEEEE